MKTAALIPALGLALLASAGAAWSADAGNYPDRPVRMVVPNAPGSSVDTLSRIVAQKLSEVWWWTTAPARAA
jgi:tripartite-type tricarboxylate transporter receptor subunit TctC